ncbi:glycoside hydrolase family 19 protein [Rhizobium sp. AAP43]|uniref:glycoside hydrolase family 19 protein n=1 Tax=Rhizobium sp. AAP43 TaxID=1523420 RepID=UPI000B02AE99|nr:glycoside hydrolase family 19 protein [Rhizobium sp. AAP43]
MRIDGRVFFNAVRGPVFGGRLNQGQVAGTEAIIAKAGGTRPGAAHFSDPRRLAYMLATAHHETAGTMQAVRETMASSDAEAVARLERAFRAGEMPTVSTPYWRRDESGLSYYGRGLVQLTHRRNYLRMSRVTGLDLVSAPDLALRLDVAATILVVGMSEGLFTGFRLADFFTGVTTDWTGARKIVNGRDRADKIAETAKRFDAAIRAALVVSRPEGKGAAPSETSPSAAPLAGTSLAGTSLAGMGRLQRLSWTARDAMRRALQQDFPEPP